MTHWTRLKSALRAALQVSLLLSLASNTQAITIRVAQDGSGDYEHIFDAMAAAQEGDIISIAAGEYTDARQYYPGSSLRAVGMLETPNVHVIGDSRDAVIIGPPTGPADSQSLDVGLVALAPTSGTSYENLTIRNSYAGIAESGSRLVRNCRFVGNYNAMHQYLVSPAQIEDCEFEGNDIGVLVFGDFSSLQTTFRRCRFVDNDVGIQIQNGTMIEVVDSEFSGGRVGLFPHFAGDVTLRRCSIRANSMASLYCHATVLSIFECRIGGSTEYNLLEDHSTIIARDVIFEGGTIATLRFRAPESVDMLNNHINNGGGLSVDAWTTGTGGQVISLAGNWWGTTDADQVEAWVHHAPDDPQNNELTVDYLPLLGVPVSGGRSSMGQLKVSFGRD